MYVRSERKGSIVDLAVLAPDVARFARATETTAEAAGEMLADREVGTLSAKVFAAAVRALRSSGRWITTRIPEDKRFVFGEATIMASMPVRGATGVIVRMATDRAGPFGERQEIRVLFRLPGRHRIRSGGRVILRGTLTGKQGDVYVVKSYQVYPAVPKGSPDEEWP